MNLKPYLWMACLPCLVQAPQALAGTINIHGNIDLSTISPGTFSDTKQQNAVGFGQSFSPSILISKGDTVSVDIDFLSGQYLTLTSTGGTQELNGWLHQDYTIDDPNTSYFQIHSTTGMKFYNGTSNVLSLFPTNKTGGATHIGTSYMGNFIGTGNSMTFNRYTFSFIVDNLTTDGTDSVDSRHYMSPFMRFVADKVSLTLGNTTPANQAPLNQVPLPNSLWLMFSGVFLLLGKKKRTQA